MKVLHILAGGGTGGIETLCKDYALFSRFENIILILWGTGGSIAEEMKKNGTRVIELDASMKKMPLVLKQIFNICKQEKIDSAIVHHAAPLAHLILLAIKQKYSNVLTFTYAHGNAVDMCREKDKKGLWVRKSILAYSLKKSDGVIAISESVKESLIDYLCIPETQITVIYNGVNTDKFYRKIDEVAVPINIVYVGRLIKEKGVQVTLEALAHLSDEFDYRFKIIGDGSYRGELEKLAKSLDLTKKVEFLGNRKDVCDLLKDADMFIHMPIWEEGFGITIIEAMAAGLVCVCANSGAIPEIISHEENGYIVCDRTSEGLTKTLESVKQQIEDKKIVAIQNNAQESAKKFSIFNYANKLDALIMSKVEGKRK